MNIPRNVKRRNSRNLRNNRACDNIVQFGIAQLDVNEPTIFGNSVYGIDRLQNSKDAGKEITYLNFRLQFQRIKTSGFNFSRI